jgi:putative ABC transport system substrate-binding protein
MKRREFVALIGGALAASSLTTSAQQAAPAIGFLSGRSQRDSVLDAAAFRKGLAEMGFTDGRNVAIQYRWAEGRYDHLHGMVTDLVNRPVAAIAAFGPEPALAAKRATAMIPVVFTTGNDPVKAGLVASLGHPGGNVTGVSFFSGELGAKRLELLKLLIGKMETVGLLLNLDSRDAEEQKAEMEAATRNLGAKLEILSASPDRKFESIFDTTTRLKLDALVVSADPFLFSQRASITALAAKHKIPAVYVNRGYAEAGGLLSYGASQTDAYRQVGNYVGRILKGEKPADLPVLQPIKFDLVVNAKAAKALGLSVPDRLIALADDVIE